MLARMQNACMHAWTQNTRTRAWTHARMHAHRRKHSMRAGARAWRSHSPLLVLVGAAPLLRHTPSLARLRLQLPAQ